MKKVLESTFIILLFSFAFIGVIASIFLIRELYLVSKYEELYINNCENVRAGMTVEEAKVTMGGANYRENEKGYSYWTTFLKDKPTEFLLSYPTSGASYIVSIKYDPITGLVTEVECSGH